ncbi:ABC-type transporter, permease component [Thiohalobacter thiocyanaticus]|uniref:ABC-type transporter, permease component n=1 Tax=Thiohalobacter thiocyanaticus TaxID=585455 RepID=A0A1Z4VTF4_9GAMM|nr:Fe-S cluster assembly protein SufD [Thiohalobacter thiocyanaticus]BAZ94682.1 ABC-type transporter, permease component [Thiohalobacter thiocyanaticus]
MSEALKPVEHYRELIDAARSTLPGAGQQWLETRRQAAAARFEEQGFPTRKAEEWRYSNIGQVLEQPFRYRDEAFEALTDSDIDELLLVEQPAARLVFANGRLVPHLSATGGLDSAVSLISLRDAIDSDSDFVDQWLGKAIIDNDLETFEALNTALLNDGMCLYIPAGVAIEQPIEVLYLSVGLDEPSVMTPRNLIVLDQGASARLVEQYASTTDAAYFNNGLTEIMLGEDAELEHDRLQDEAAQAYHMSVIHLAQAARSRYRGMVASLGGTWARTEYHTAFSAEEANCELAGFYFAGDGQLTDIHLDVRHPVPRCNSEQKFKGILAGRGKAVLDGRIRVIQDAQQTEAHLSNDTLLLSRSAEVDTKPQLEIFADDVKCSHGTTVGQLDPMQLFYLRARGINADTARKMLCLGFADEVLESCTVPAFIERVDQKLQHRLADVNIDTTASG